MVFCVRSVLLCFARFIAGLDAHIRLLFLASKHQNGSFKEFGLFHYLSVFKMSQKTRLMKKPS